MEAGVVHGVPHLPRHDDGTADIRQGPQEDAREQVASLKLTAGGRIDDSVARAT
jgi:hypothetical protein